MASEDNSEEHKLLGEKFETSKLLLTAGLQKIFEGLTEEEVSWAFLVCGRNQQGIGTSAITRWVSSNFTIIDELSTCISSKICKLHHVFSKVSCFVSRMNIRYVLTHCFAFCSA